MLDAPLRFGIFLAPFHPIDENPALALERDFQLVEHLDGLGYDEAWIGEHHSAGYETIASPEVFIAAAGRSEERRVGKESIARGRRSPEETNKQATDSDAGCDV